METGKIVVNGRGSSAQPNDGVGWCEMLGWTATCNAGGRRPQVFVRTKVSEVDASVRGGLSLGSPNRARTRIKRNRLGERGRTVLLLPEEPRAAAWRAVLMAYAEAVIRNRDRSRPRSFLASISGLVRGGFRRNADAGEKPTLVSRRVYQTGNCGRFLLFLPKSTRLNAIERKSVSRSISCHGRAGAAGAMGRVEFIYSPWWHGRRWRSASAGWFGRPFWSVSEFLAGFRRSRNLTRSVDGRFGIRVVRSSQSRICFAASRVFFGEDSLLHCRRARNNDLQVRSIPFAASSNRFGNGEPVITPLGSGCPGDRKTGVRVPASSGREE